MKESNDNMYIKVKEEIKKTKHKEINHPNKCIDNWNYYLFKVL